MSNSEHSRAEGSVLAEHVLGVFESHHDAGVDEVEKGLARYHEMEQRDPTLVINPDAIFQHGKLEGRREGLAALQAAILSLRAELADASPLLPTDSTPEG